MNAFRFALSMRGAMKNQWMDESRIREMQARKLRALIREAYHHTFHYRALFDAWGIDPDEIRTPEDLCRVPVTRKTDLQRLQPELLLNRRFFSSCLTVLRSSGSTGSPFAVRFDSAYAAIRNALFYRGLRAAGYAPGDRIFLVTDTKAKRSWRPGWHYASILDHPALLLEKLNRIRPKILYGCKTPLIRMAECMMRPARGRAFAPAIVISTAEMLDRADRRLLESAFCAEVFDFYGSSEMGLVGWECSGHRGFHISQDSVLVEFLPLEGRSRLSRLVMTNLDLLAMPLIRYDSGDVGAPMPPASCPCGRKFARIERIEGRRLDCPLDSSGRIVSPYQITCALGAIPGIERFQVIEEAACTFQVKIKALPNQSEAVKTRIEIVMRQILGRSVAVAVLFENDFEPPPGAKFRVVKSRTSAARTHHENTVHQL